MSVNNNTNQPYMPFFHTPPALQEQQQLAMFQEAYSNYINQLNPALSQTLMSFPLQQQLAMIQDVSNQLQRYTAASQTPVALPQQLQAAPGTYYQWPLVPAQTASISPEQVAAALPEVDKVQGQTDSTDESSESICYGDTTWITVDEEAREVLKSYGQTTIHRWVGQDLKRIINGEQEQITVRIAKIINAKAPKLVFNIIADNVISFTIDPLARNILKGLSIKCNFKLICEEVKFAGCELTDIKKNDEIQSISKEHAEKYNKYFRENHNIKPDLFNLNQILKLALAEDVSKRIKGTLSSKISSGLASSSKTSRSSQMIKRKRKNGSSEKPGSIEPASKKQRTQERSDDGKHIVTASVSTASNLQFSDPNYGEISTDLNHQAQSPLPQQFGNSTELSAASQDSGPTTESNAANTIQLPQNTMTSFSSSTNSAEGLEEYGDAWIEEL